MRTLKMLAPRGRTSLMDLAVVALVAALIVSGCGFRKPQPTPIVGYATPSPTATASEPPAVEPSPSAAPTETAGASPTPAPTATPRPFASAVASTVCTGSATNQQFFADTAKALPWDVYCGVVPSGWYFFSANYEQPGGGWLKATYHGPSGAQISISEGAFCVPDAVACAPSAAVVGAASFGDLPGSLVTLSGGGFAIYVAPGTARGYTITGSGLTQESFVAIAAALARVAKG
jgi:hypothetical protein